MPDDVMQEIYLELHGFEVARDMPCGPEKQARITAVRERIEQLIAVASRNCPEPDTDKVLKSKEYNNAS